MLTINKIKRQTIMVLAASLMAACALPKAEREALQKVRPGLVDKNASNQTTALFYNLKNSAKTEVMFGHMEDNKNGREGWNNVPNRSDVYEVTGAYPAIFGFDFGGITSFKTGDYYDKERKVIHDRAIEAYKRNGIITFSWHYDNPVSKGSFYWDKSPVNAVSEILPNGHYNAVFKESLDKIAAFAGRLKCRGKLVPVIFRPFHEFDGDWFWWGKAHCSVDDYKALYRYTVTYLRDTLHVKNFLYAWSPDCRFDSREKYLERYPGDEYVDVVGMDDYSDMKDGKPPIVAADKLKIVSDYALAQHKIAAFTETGLENIPQTDWFTNTLLKVLKAEQTQIAYVMVWSNRQTSYWTPYKGHPAEADFIHFKNDPYVIFDDKMSDFYRITLPDKVK